MVEFPNGKLDADEKFELEVVLRHRRADKNASPWINVQELEKTHPKEYHERQVALYSLYNRNFDKSGTKRKAREELADNVSAMRIAELEEQLEAAKKRLKTFEEAPTQVPEVVELDAGNGKINKALTINLKSGDATVVFKMPNGGEARARMLTDDEEGRPICVKAIGAFKLTFDAPEQ